MKRHCRIISRRIVPLSLLAAAAWSAAARAAVQPIAWYRLGDDDPGAAAGNVANNPTLDHTLNHLDLTRAGAPHYSADVPANVAAAASADKLSMKLFNFTGPLDIAQPEPNYYMRGGAVTSTSAAYALETWVKSSPLGQGDPSGYTLISYNGVPFYNGIGFFQHGKNYVVRIGSSYEKVLAPASSNTWTHLAFVRQNTANDFYVNGVEQPDLSAGAQSSPGFVGGSFYVGGFGNPLSASALPPRYLFSGLVDEARFSSYPTVTATPSADFLIAEIPRELNWAGSSGTWDTTQPAWRDPSGDAAAWHNLAPDDAIFGGAGASSADITVAGPMTVGKITFDGTTTNYALAGGGAITLNAPLGEGIAANQSAVINAPVQLANDQRWDVAVGQTLTVNAPVSGAGVEKAGAGTLSIKSFSTSSISVTGGTLVMSGAAATSDTNALAVAPGAQLDVTDNNLVVHGGDVAAISALVKSGRNEGAWDGDGIITSEPAATATAALTTLGVAKAEDAGYVGRTFGGIAVAAGDVLLMYTRGGDANLDARIDGDDYFQIDSGFPQGLHGWFNGDFNYDGVINGDDYFIIDSNFPAQGAAFAPEGAVAVVPEPAAAAVAGACMIAIASLPPRRRRPRHPAAA